ncbi:unnamed protein product, partial [Linum tenue]
GEDVGHQDKPFGDERPAIVHEVAEHEPIGPVTESPIPRDTDAEERRQNDCVAYA